MQLDVTDRLDDEVSGAAHSSGACAGQCPVSSGQSDDATLSRGTRTKASIRRSLAAGIICLVSVLILILSIALPKWLVRDREILNQGSDERLSAGVSIGLFTICEDTLTGKCYKCKF